MAIKVKHDGNVTSRIYASAAGGKGKRQAEDAIKLAQLQASATGRGGGGTGGNAHASAAAPTLHAPTGHAQLGSTGGFISPQLSVNDRARIADDQLNNRLIELDALADDRAEEQNRQADLTEELHQKDFKRSEQAQLTAQGRREREALVNAIIDGIKAGRFSPEELPKLMEQFGIAEDTIRMADALREHQPTPEEDFKRNTYTDQNGVVFDRTGKVLYNPQDIQMRQSEAEAKRLDALKARADKFEAELRKPYRTSQVVKNTDGVSEDVKDSYAMRTEEEIEAIMRQRFPELYPSATNAPQSPVDPYYTQKFMEMDDKFFPKPTAPQTPSAANAPRSQDVTGAGQKPRADMPAVAKTPEDAKKKWGVKK